MFSMSTLHIICVLHGKNTSTLEIVLSCDWGKMELGNGEHPKEQWNTRDYELGNGEHPKEQWNTRDYYSKLKDTQQENMEPSFRRWHSAIKCNTPVVSTKDRDSRNIDEKKMFWGMISLVLSFVRELDTLWTLIQLLESVEQMNDSSLTFDCSSISKGANREILRID
ncbi:LOW QUALITY PROTEIN: hypothetical protein NC652_019055 [Populus alba x Populus x berolinensis]|nr:LOW QUALITY PROTEIN: hypothetical protein NC652_019055 [Populus alba x Populus x berolinensis]